MLVGSLGDDNEEVRQIVAAVLGKIGKAAVPALSRALKDDTVLVRGRRAGLAGSGRPGKEAVPAVVAVLKDTSKDVRSFAVSTLLQIDPAARPSCRPWNRPWRTRTRACALGPSTRWRSWPARRRQRSRCCWRR